MRTWLSLIAAALLVAFSAPAFAAPAVGDQAPDIEFTKTWNGEQSKLSDFKGEFVFLNFWATW